MTSSYSLNTSPTKMKKEERPRIPSPTPTMCTTVTTALRQRVRQPSPTPSTSSAVSASKAPIRIRPLSSLLEPDDNMSTVTSANQGPSLSRDSQLGSTTLDDPKDWRYSQKDIAHRLKYIFEHENTYQDVIFEVGKDKVRFKAHQLILRITSPVFDQLLQGTRDCPGHQISSSQQLEKIVRIDNVEPHIFKYLLKYIYTDELSRSRHSSADILSMLQAAKLYRINRLYERCKGRLQKNLSCSIAIPLCELAAKYKDEDLLESAFRQIADRAFDIFTSEEFLLLSEQNLSKLLDRDDLNIDELSVFLNVVRWAQAKCKEQGIPETSNNLRMIMNNNLLFKIRFTLMDSEEIVLQVQKVNILSPEERVQVMDYLCVEPGKRDQLPPILFNTTPRRSRKSRELESITPERKETTPVRAPSVVTEFIDISSSEHEALEEEESESGTSTHSERKAKDKSKEKLKRHHSLVSTSGTRKSKKRRRRSSASNNLQMIDLFEVPNLGREIVLVNKDVNLEDYIQHLSSFDNLHEIETITFDNVKILDYKTLKGMKLPMEGLKSFKLNIKVDESIIAMKDLHKLLFFETGKDSWQYSDIFSTGIMIHVIINKVIMLRIAHQTQCVTLNNFSGAPMILKSLQKESIKGLVHQHPEFDEKNVPLDLNRLVISNPTTVKGISMEGFIQRFTRLKELIIFLPTVGNPYVAPIRLDKKLKPLGGLKILGLRGFNLSIDSSLRLENMTALYLWKAVWDKTFEEKIHHIFPNLVEITLVTQELSTRLVKNLLRISKLKEIVCWRVEWVEDSDFEDIKTRFKVELNSNDKWFRLQRMEDGRWGKKEKLLFNGWQQHAFNKFGYMFLYEDVEVFSKSKYV